MEACLGVALAMGLAAACSRPAPEAANSTTASADAAATTSAPASEAVASNEPRGVTPGGAVSPPPANGNDAVNPDTNKSDASQSAASNSFTQSQAKGHIEKAGYTDVSALTKTPDGRWTGTAKKDGKPVNVSVDFKGAVSAE
jgi:putative membrane protein